MVFEYNESNCLNLSTTKKTKTALTNKHVQTASHITILSVIFGHCQKCHYKKCFLSSNENHFNKCCLFLFFCYRTYLSLSFLFVCYCKKLYRLFLSCNKVALVFFVVAKQYHCFYNHRTKESWFFFLTSQKASFQAVSSFLQHII